MIIAAIISVSFMVVIAEPPLHNGYGYEFRGLSIDREPDRQAVYTWGIDSNIDSTMTLYVENFSREMLHGFADVTNLNTGGTGGSEYYVKPGGECCLCGSFSTKSQDPPGSVSLDPPIYTWSAVITVVSPRSNVSANYYWVHRVKVVYP